MDKARQGTGGAAISVVAYQGELIAVQDELKVIDATARDKKCKNPGELEQHFRHQVRGTLFSALERMLSG
jgi:hypothetical protein